MCVCWRWAVVRAVKVGRHRVGEACSLAGLSSSGSSASPMPPSRVLNETVSTVASGGGSTEGGGTRRHPLVQRGPLCARCESGPTPAQPLAPALCRHHQPQGDTQRCVCVCVRGRGGERWRAGQGAKSPRHQSRPKKKKRGRPSPPPTLLAGSCCSWRSTRNASGDAMVCGERLVRREKETRSRCVSFFLWLALPRLLVVPPFAALPHPSFRTRANTS